MACACSDNFACNMNEDEGALYDDLRDSRLPGLRRHVRLEQERIGFDWVRAALRNNPRNHCCAVKICKSGTE
jgi:hypothetical protein